MLLKENSKKIETVKTLNSSYRLYFFDCEDCKKEIHAQFSSLKSHSGKCRACVKKSINDPVQAAIDLLIKEGFKAEKAPKKKVAWTCPEGHSRISLSYDILKGHRCVFCKRKLRTPRVPNVLKPRDRNGNLEVVSYFGVVDGFTRVEVRNVNSGIVAVMTTGDFISGRRKLLSTEEKSAIFSQNGKNRKGLPNPSNATHTWGDVRNICQAVGFEFSHSELKNEEPVFDTARSRWNFKCHCGRSWLPSLNNLIRGVNSCGCVKSKPQMDLNLWVQELGFETIVNDKTKLGNETDNRKGLEIDILIPSLNVAIEYCGLFWHGQGLNGSSARTKHLDKMKACEGKGIRLITIFEDEWLFRQEAVKGYLTAILGKKTQIIGARKCQISSIDKKVAKSFLNQWHIQGSSNGQHIGIFFKEELLAVSTWAKLNASRNTTGWELSRFCVKGGVSVPGALPKMTKVFFFNNPEVLKVLSYSDNRWSNGQIYQALGFTKQKTNPPSYWYFQRKEPKRFHRFKWRKSEALRVFGGSPENTEWEILGNNGWDRIWDCGSTAWLLNRPNT
jgi:hypothetical protein